MNDRYIFRRVTNVSCMYCRKDIVKKNITMTLGEFFANVIYTISLNNQLICISHIYVTCDRVSLVILVGNEDIFVNWCIICKLYPRKWIKNQYIYDERWTIKLLKSMSKADYDVQSRLGLKEVLYLELVTIDNYIQPILHNRINL